MTDSNEKNKGVNRRQFVGTVGAVLAIGLVGKTAAGQQAQQTSAPKPGDVWQAVVEGPFTTDTKFEILGTCAFADPMDLEFRKRDTSEKLDIRFQYLGSADPARKIQLEVTGFDINGAPLGTVTTVTTDQRVVNEQEGPISFSGLELWRPEHNTETIELGTGSASLIQSISLTLTYL